jgi:putative addiction module killer protein
MATHLTISYFCAAYGISRNMLRHQINRGLIPHLKEGDVTLISLVDAEAWAEKRKSIATRPPVPYKGHMVEVVQTDIFKKWFDGLRDRQAQQHILVRIGRIQRGNFGDVKAVGVGISELRIHYRARYRLNLAQQGEALVLLLCGGDKDSQDRDIVKAKKLAMEWDIEQQI